MDPLRRQGVGTVMRAPLAFAIAFTLLIALAGCGGAARKDDPVHHFDPLEFKAQATPAGPKVYIRDFNTLFEEAMDHYRAKRFDDAIARFDLILKEFPKHAGLVAAQFNAGLAADGKGDHAEAAKRFGDVLVRAKGKRDARDAMFRLMTAYEKLGRWKDLVALVRPVLDDAQAAAAIGGKLGLLDELEARARLGIAMRKAGDVPAAEKMLKSATRIYLDRREVLLVAQSEWVPRAYLEQGSIYRDLFGSIRFRLPVEKMERDLDDKSSLFLKAQEAYLRAVRLHHPEFSVAAGFELGQLYERFVDDLDQAEVPADFDKESLEIYREELWKHTAPLVRHAIDIYRRNLTLAEELRAKGDWRVKTEAQLKRMEALVTGHDKPRAPKPGTPPARTTRPPTKKPVAPKMKAPQRHAPERAPSDTGPEDKATEPEDDAGEDRTAG